MATVTLPVGVPHPDAELRPLTGEDEAWLLDLGGSLLPARRTTLLLHRCLSRLGPLAPVPLDAVRSLAVGDREALLLHLRRLTLGETLSCVLRCPACGEKMDLDLRVSDLLMPPVPSGRDQHEAEMDGIRIRFRLPTGGDQEEAAELALTDPDAAAELLLRRCLGKAPDGLSPRAAESLSDRMAELDPQAELRLELTCPSCEQGFSTIFDAGSHLFQELRNRGLSLYREVHALAFHYHWSEREILEMSGRKRRLYLDLLAEALSEGGTR